MTTAARAGSPSQSLLSGPSVAGSASATQNPTARIATTNRNGNLSGPTPRAPRAAPSIMMAPTVTGIPSARSQDAHLGVPSLLKAAAYPPAIASIPTKSAMSAERRVGSTLVVSGIGTMCSGLSIRVRAEPAAQMSPASVRPRNRRPREACSRRDAHWPHRAQSRDEDLRRPTRARASASTTPDSG